MKVWRILGRSQFDPPPPDWRTALATRLGQRPRRIGSFAELALSGALACLDDAGESRLPQAALLSVSSLIGPERALQSALADLKTELPMPISFLQSQPAQVLPVLAQHLGWQGNARCLATRNPLSALQLASLEAPAAGGMLIGWVDEEGGDKSLWLRAVAEESGAMPCTGDAPSLSRLIQPNVRAFAFEPGAVTGSKVTCHILTG